MTSKKELKKIFFTFRSYGGNFEKIKLTKMSIRNPKNKQKDVIGGKESLSLLCS